MIFDKNPRGKHIRISIRFKPLEIINAKLRRSKANKDNSYADARKIPLHCALPIGLKGSGG